MAVIRTGAAFVAALLITSLGSTAASSDPPRTSSHPLFNDGGTLSWSTDLAEAQKAAREKDRLIFVECGRRQCTNCRVLVQVTMPLPCVKDRFSALCVGLASDCDEMDPRVDEIFRANLKGARVLPYVGVLTADLQWITGWAGAATPQQVSCHLSKAEAWRTEHPAVKTVEAQPTAKGPCPAAQPRSATVVGQGREAVGPPPEDADRAAALLASAREAAKAGQWCEVRRLDAEARRLPVRVDPAAWAELAANADRWCEERLSAALAAAKDRRAGDAKTILAGVRRGAAAGTPLAEEASKGERALARLSEVNAAPEAGRDAARQAAFREFAGSRWATLFQG